MSHIIEADYGGGILLICGGDDEAKEEALDAAAGEQGEVAKAAGEGREDEGGQTQEQKEGDGWEA